MESKKILLFMLGLSVPLGCSPVGGDENDGDDSATDGDDETNGTADETNGGGENGDETDTGGTGTDTGTDMECPFEGEGECSLNEDCPDTGYCRSFSNAPPDPAASCDEPDPDEAVIEILGTVRNFGTFAPVADMDVKVSGALPTLTDPVGAPAVAMATSNSSGRIETTSDQVDGEAIGIVAIIGGEGTPYSVTASGLVEVDLAVGAYPPGVDNHDLWVVPQTLLDDWSDLLASDSAVAPYLPLGGTGGVVGHVRDSECGFGAEGIVVAPHMGFPSQALIRYLDEDGQGFNTNATSSNGYFIVVNPSLAEKFDAVRDGQVVHKREATVGSTPGGIFAVTLILEDEG